MTSLSGTKPYFFKSLRINLSAARLFPPGLDQNVEHFALGVHGAPEVDQATIDLEIDLVEMPDRMRLRPAFAKIGCDLGSKMVHPAAHRLIGNHDSAFRQQILDVAEAQGEPDIKPDRLLDDLGREAVAAIADLGHHRWLRLKSRNGKPTDNVTMPLRALYKRDPQFATYMAQQVGMSQNMFNAMVKEKGALEALLAAEQKYAASTADIDAAEKRQNAWQLLIAASEQLGRSILTQLTPTFLRLVSGDPGFHRQAWS